MQRKNGNNFKTVRHEELTFFLILSNASHEILDGYFTYYTLTSMNICMISSLSPSLAHSHFRRMTTQILSHSLFLSLTHTRYSRSTHVQKFTADFILTKGFSCEKTMTALSLSTFLGWIWFLQSNI